MHVDASDIQAMDRIQRIHLINSMSGVKPANLIGTVSETGLTNVAIFSSVVHLGSNPPLMGCIVRPAGEVPRNTYENILDTGVYTINHIHESFVKQAHYTSAKFDADQSEFDLCNLTEEYLDDFKAPYVGESHIKMGLSYVQSIPLEINDTILLIGKIEHIHVHDDAISEDGQLDLGALKNVGISGLNRYYSLNKVNEIPYARVSELPDFSSK